MHDRAALKTIAGRAAVSAIAGLLVAAFAAAALAFGTGMSADGLPVDRTISGSLAPVVSAIVGAGSLASIVVFACLIANDVVRKAGPWLVAQRGLLLAPFRAIAWLVAQIALAMLVAVQFVIRSTVFVEAVWLVRTVGRPVMLVLGYGAVIGLCAIVYVGIIVSGFACIGESTRFLVATLDDPPRQFAMALSIGGATALMYVGVGALALSLWLAYRLTRASVRRAAALWPRTAAP
jgi:hypothetical protein